VVCVSVWRKEGDLMRGLLRYLSRMPRLRRFKDKCTFCMMDEYLAFMIGYGFGFLWCGPVS
jgi:hypothetical protein